ncbi:MAG: hypothetical protein SXA11_19400 [Cyanobacteriota bacterium]|nr:hypothetical protein [Cyanobacteriota bacterium]
MEDLNAITFKAFIVALSLLEIELPKAKQAELNQIGREIALGLTDLGRLDDFAESYNILDKIYQQIRTLMTDSNLERNKCDLPIINEASEAEAREITNVVKTAAEVDEEKQDDWFLVLQDINSVKAAKNKMKVMLVVPSSDGARLSE